MDIKQRAALAAAVGRRRIMARLAEGAGTQEAVPQPIAAVLCTTSANTKHPLFRGVHHVFTFSHKPGLHPILVYTIAFRGVHQVVYKHIYLVYTI